MGTGKHIVDFIKFTCGERSREVLRTRLTFLQPPMVGKRLPDDDKSQEEEHKETEPCMVELHTLKKEESCGGG